MVRSTNQQIPNSIPNSHSDTLVNSTLYDLQYPSFKREDHHDITTPRLHGQTLTSSFSVGTRSLATRTFYHALKIRTKSGAGENGVALSPIIDLQDGAQAQVPLPAESAGPISELSDQRPHEATGAAPSPLATVSGEHPQHTLQQGVREAEGPQGVLSRQANFPSSSQGSKGKAAAGETPDIDVGGGAVPDGAAMNSVSQESREEYVSWRVPGAV